MPDLRDDERKIVELTVRYTTAIDDRQEERLLECFTEDADLDYGAVGRRTYESIVEHMRNTPRRNGRHATPFVQSRRIGRWLGCTLRCNFRGTAYWRVGVGSRVRHVHGRYEDNLIRTDMGWRIRARHVAYLYEASSAMILGAS
jgi:hypothetical protein